MKLEDALAESLTPHQADEEERENVSGLQLMCLHPDEPGELFAVFITVRWAFGKDRSIHEWAVWNLCQGRLSDGVEMTHDAS